MNLYEACVNLDVWRVVKAYAEVWSISKSHNGYSVDNLKSIIKTKFKQLAIQHHPDVGGDNDVYLNIKESYDIIKKSTVNDFISSLNNEKSNIIYLKSGSCECEKCVKWSNITSMCITSTCTGFKPLKSNLINKNREPKLATG